MVVCSPCWQVPSQMPTATISSRTWHRRRTLSMRLSPVGFTQTTINPPAIALTPGENDTGVDFGNFQLISISGTKFQDTNGNGVPATR